MNDAKVAARIVDALTQAAARELGAGALLVSVNIDVLAAPAEGAPEISVARRTKTLLFLHGEFRDQNGQPIAVANSVHKMSH
jgi:hypothetical protein